jgi:hypothetical protein
LGPNAAHIPPPYRPPPPPPQAAQALVLERQAALARADAERAKKIEEQNLLRQAEAERRRIEAEERIASNKAAAEAANAARVRAQERAAALAEERRLELERRRLAAIEGRRQEAELEAERRKLTAAAAKRDEDTRLMLLELRMAAEAEAVAKIQEQERREALLQREHNRVQGEAKADAVERSRQRDNYRRLVVQQQIDEKLQRGAARMAAKKEAARIRRDMAAQAARQRDKVLETMEGLKGKDLGRAQVRARRGWLRARFWA